MSSKLNSFIDGRKHDKGFMIAEVADNLDMTEAYAEGKMIGRLKLSIPGISNELDKEDMPWAYQLTQVGSGTHDGVGAFRVPAIGTKVVCMKIDDQYGWIVLGELNTTLHTLEDYAEDYPETWGMRDKTGNKSVINMAQEYAQFTHSSGTNILCIHCGGVTETIVGFHEETTAKWWNKAVAEYGNETYGEYFHLTAADEITLKAPNIYLDGNVTVYGWVHADLDVVAGTVSLQKHTHPVPHVDLGPSTTISRPPIG